MFPNYQLQFDLMFLMNQLIPWNQKSRYYLTFRTTL
jgi:hypothetical protein